jgi:hypothetical protein
MRCTEQDEEDEDEERREEGTDGEDSDDEVDFDQIKSQTSIARNASPLEAALTCTESTVRLRFAPHFSFTCTCK